VNSLFVREDHVVVAVAVDIEEPQAGVTAFGVDDRSTRGSE